jgi:hypothetical protein
VGVEAEHGGWGADFYGEDVPEVERDYVGDQEVDVFAGVDGAGLAGRVCRAGFVGSGAERVGGFDLDAEEGFAVVEDEVVTFAVAPGFGYD